MEHAAIWLLLVLAVVLLAAAVAVRRRVLFRMAVRNAGRRRAQVALVVAGLVVATSILSGSFVVGDSLRFAIRKTVFEGFDAIDEVVVLPRGDGFFGEDNHTRLAGRLGVMEHVDAIAPRIVVRATVVHPAERLSEARTNLIGFDPASDPGTFVLRDGAETDGGGLGRDRVYVNDELADTLQAVPGSDLLVFLEGRSAPVRVEGVLRPEGKAQWSLGPNAFLPLPHLQALLGRPGEINEIVVSNVGGVEDGHLATDGAIREVDEALGTGHPFTIQDSKRDAIESADRTAAQLTDLFTLLGVFTVIAGLMLILSIVVMLAEERKTEMGIQRAIGLRRSHLTQLFSLEGMLYALTAAAVGALAGLAVAAAILFAIGRIVLVDLELRWEASSLVVGFALGFLLTMATILVASGRISRLNIVRAIRNIPEPVPRRMPLRLVALAAGMVAAGLGAIALAFSDEAFLYLTLGVGLVVLGLAVLLHRVVGARAAFTTAGVALIAWQVLPLVEVFPGTSPGIDLFIVTGLLMITGGVLLVVFNNDVILGVLARTVGRGRKVQPVLRTAVAYPMARRGRTGLILGIFALIVFTIVVLASIQALIGNSIEVFEREASGGYDVFGVSDAGATLVDPTGNTVPFADYLRASDVADEVALHEELLLAVTTVKPPHEGEVLYGVYGVDDAFVERNGFSFYRRAAGFAEDRDVWRELRANPDVAVVDRNVQPVDFGPSNPTFRADVGDDVLVRNGSGATRAVRIIGILDSQVVRGLYMGAAVVRGEFGVDAPSFFMFRLEPDADPVLVGREIERTFASIRMQTFAIRPIVDETTQVTNSFFDLLEGYLAMGLLVGMAGLGIITMRNVVERRAEIGALRAIGFRRSMVLKSLLIETSYVALVGIAVGVALGILLGHRIWLEFIPQAEAFVIPWGRIALVSGLAYAAALASTVSPSVRAARLPPAEALRFVE